MKIISWNLNGIRAVQKKGLIDLMNEKNADIYCFQETKAHVEQLDEALVNIPGYESAWFSAEKKGYSSVATYSKIKSNQIVKGFDGSRFDTEGRVLRHDFGDISLFNIYFPNGQRDDERLQYKLDFYDYCLSYWENLRKEGRKLIICGDYNTAHHPIDLARPDDNIKISGFLPIEREWMDKFESRGYHDTFRMFNSNAHQYTWWSARTMARERNIGWRIDYFYVSDELKNKVKDAFIWQDIYGSDHCPLGIEIDF
jgi:exodeoxyribonuclease-3